MAWRTPVQCFAQRPVVQLALSPQFDRVLLIQSRCGAANTAWFSRPQLLRDGPVDQLATATMPPSPRVIGPPESPWQAPMPGFLPPPAGSAAQSRIRPGP